MAASEKVKVTAELDRDLYEGLIALANKRGVNANTALQQAIMNETFIANETADGSKVLIEQRDKTLRQVRLSGAS